MEIFPVSIIMQLSDMEAIMFTGWKFQVLYETNNYCLIFGHSCAHAQYIDRLNTSLLVSILLGEVPSSRNCIIILFLLS